MNGIHPEDRAIIELANTLGSECAARLQQNQIRRAREAWQVVARDYTEEEYEVPQQQERIQQVEDAAAPSSRYETVERGSAPPSRYDSDLVEHAPAPSWRYETIERSLAPSSNYDTVDQAIRPHTAQAPPTSREHR